MVGIVINGRLWIIFMRSGIICCKIEYGIGMYGVLISN